MAMRSRWTALLVAGLTATALIAADTPPTHLKLVGDHWTAWDPPTTNADGTSLTDLAGYKLYHGTASRQYAMVLDVGNATAFTVDSLPAGTRYFAVTAYDASGNESVHSLEVWTTLP